LVINEIDVFPEDMIFEIPGEISPTDILDIMIVVQDDENGAIEVLGISETYNPSPNHQANLLVSLTIPADLPSNNIPLRLSAGEHSIDYQLTFVPNSEWSPAIVLENLTGTTGEVSLTVQVFDLNGNDTIEEFSIEQELNFQETGDKQISEFISNHSLAPIEIRQVAPGLYEVGFYANWPGRFPLLITARDADGNERQERVPVEIYWAEQPFEIRGIGTGWILPGDPNFYDAYFQLLAEANVNLLQILVAGHMETINSNEVHDCEYTWSPDSACTGVSFETAGRLIQEAHSRGIAVMLAPQVVPGSYEPTWKIRPASWDAWFSLQPADPSYSNWILRWAEFAEQNGVEVFSVGNELTSSHRYQEHWENLIAAVREAYSGMITYADNYWVFWLNSEYPPFPACSLLDLQGVNFYFRGSGDLYAGPALIDPTPDQIYTNLENQVDRMLLQFREPSCGGIPIIITEMGMFPIDGANTRPESSDFDHPIQDNQEQVDFFTMVWSLAADHNFHGIVVWQLQPQREAWSGIEGVPGDLKGLPVMEALRIYFETP
jgi:hypothetical protein